MRIKKSYEGFPSQTRIISQNRGSGKTSFEECEKYLDITERSWIRNGGLVIGREPGRLVVEEADESNLITFEIID